MSGDMKRFNPFISNYFPTENALDELSQQINNFVHVKNFTCQSSNPKRPNDNLYTPRAKLHIKCGTNLLILWIKCGLKS